MKLILHKQSDRAGFSLIELMIGIAVAGLILGNLAMVVRTSTSAVESGVFGSNLEDRADRTMDRIALALMSTSAEKLDEVQFAPNHVSAIDYEVIVDVVDGDPFEGVPERIEFDAQEGRIIWKRAPDSPDEMQNVWTRWVPGMQEGETFNGIDDNGNGLADEEGLAFNRDAEQILVRLTLEREDSKKVVYVRSRSRRVTCRN
ncbi:MAG: prepilin-type N-terminal cleavage/methylation domain-containing protein [Planctomycetes bacterium]|nr:prepilin-type N-terminal cleavage/methylation domain-containing protein [Planctomycetota bacterium]MCB9903931.1 prepilin-type N-terminal cleavage/methylation domain-containing protein [Planctomycetota bacterium]